MLRETDSLTYLNAIKVTLTELKSELQQIEQLAEYISTSVERTRKLQRKADNQYRLVAKLVSKESPYATDITIEEAESLEELQKLMEE